MASATKGRPRLYSLQRFRTRELSAGGTTLMPLDNYGFSRRFGCINDRFGVSWQLNLV